MSDQHKLALRLGNEEWQRIRVILLDTDISDLYPAFPREAFAKFLPIPERSDGKTGAALPVWVWRVIADAISEYGDIPDWDAAQAIREMLRVNGWPG